MNKITNCLWFDGRAEEAMHFYRSLFPNGKEGSVSRRGDGTVLAVTFEIAGVPFMGLNGGPMFQFTEATSFMIDCANQTEVDRFWDALTADGGQPGRCGWLKDRFGVSWQVIPSALPRCLGHADPEKAGRAMQAMMAMSKIDIAALEAAVA